MTCILVVDDETVVRELMREILELSGYETVGAQNSEGALALLEEGNVTLIVSDIMMAGTTGLELLAEVKAIRPELPVILVTGAGTDENIREAAARGADGFVSKPFSHAELRSAVASALERDKLSSSPVTRTKEADT